jgi:hypothetical protein
MNTTVKMMMMMMMMMIIQKHHLQKGINKKWVCTCKGTTHFRE